MIALTQEKREELKMFLSASMEKRCTVYTLSKQRELEVLRDQIALASLTAEPFGYIDEDAVEAGEALFSTTLYADTEDLLDYSGDKNPATLYLAPPVTEIKLPDLPESELVYETASDKFGEIGCMMITDGQLKKFIAETKRLNGWG